MAALPQHTLHTTHNRFEHWHARWGSERSDFWRVPPSGFSFSISILSLLILRLSSTSSSGRFVTPPPQIHVPLFYSIVFVILYGHSSSFLSIFLLLLFSPGGYFTSCLLCLSSSARNALPPSPPPLALIFLVYLFALRTVFLSLQLYITSKITSVIHPQPSTPTFFVIHPGGPALWLTRFRGMVRNVGMVGWVWVEWNR